MWKHEGGREKQAQEGPGWPLGPGPNPHGLLVPSLGVNLTKGPSNLSDEKPQLARMPLARGPCQEGFQMLTWLQASVLGFDLMGLNPRRRPGLHLSVSVHFRAAPPASLGFLGRNTCPQQ